MENEESKQAHIYWDGNCQCDSCRRWKDDDRVRLTDEGLEMLEMLEELGAAAQCGEVFENHELPQRFPRYARSLAAQTERLAHRRQGQPEVPE